MADGTSHNSQIPGLASLPDFLCRAEVAEQLRCTSRTLCRWEKLGIAPPRVTLGGKVLYRKETVLEWIDDRETPSNERRGN
jgi:hypothetical protein